MVVEPLAEQNQLGMAPTPVLTVKDGAECTTVGQICQMSYTHMIQ